MSLSIADLNRLKKLEAAMAEVEARIATLEARLSSLHATPPESVEPRRPVGRPRKLPN